MAATNSDMEVTLVDISLTKLAIADATFLALPFTNPAK